MARYSTEPWWYHHHGYHQRLRSWVLRQQQVSRCGMEAACVRWDRPWGRYMEECASSTRVVCGVARSGGQYSHQAEWRGGRSRRGAKPRPARGHPISTATTLGVRQQGVGSQPRWAHGGGQSATKQAAQAQAPLCQGAVRVLLVMWGLLGGEGTDGSDARLLHSHPYISRPCSHLPHPSPAFFIHVVRRGDMTLCV